MASENDFDKGAMLNNPISIADLIENGTNFEISPNYDDDDFPSKELFDDFNDSDEDDEKSREVTFSPWQKTFAELRTHMVKINENMYKKVICEGTKELGLVSERSRVTIHYNAYWENEIAPFDSTYLRGTPLVFHLEENQILVGIAEAVRTMYQNEEAQFVISYKWLFHEMGCPPRIQPKADGLFIIKVITFTDVGDANAVDQIAKEDRHKFSIVLEKAKEVHLKARDLFKQGQYNSAIKSFHRAAHALEMCTLANQDEQNEQQIFLLKLYTNLAVCYNKTNLPTKTCLICKEIRKLCDYNKNCKALFQEGRALIMLGEFEHAQKVLEKARALEPRNVDINNEIKLLAKKFQKYKANEKELWSNAMGLMQSAKSDTKDVEKPQSEEDDKFAREMNNVLENFKKNTNLKTMNLPVGLSTSEISVIADLAKDFELKVTMNPLDESKKTFLVSKVFK